MWDWGLKLVHSTGLDDQSNSLSTGPGSSRETSGDEGVVLRTRTSCLCSGSTWILPFPLSSLRTGSRRTVVSCYMFGTPESRVPIGNSGLSRRGITFSAQFYTECFMFYYLTLHVIYSHNLTLHEMSPP